MRLDKGWGSWGSEYRPIYDPYEANMGWMVKLDKAFIGRDAASASKTAGAARKLVVFSMVAGAGDDAADCIGNEPIWHNGEVIGWVTSGGYAHHSGRSIAMGYVPTELATGDGTEIGMIRELQDWPEATRDHLRAALQRRYLLRPVHRVHSAELAHGYLQFDIDADGGRSRFTLRWSGENAADFGERGKLLVDTEGNRWVVEDVEALPAPDRERFVQHIYW